MHKVLMSGHLVAPPIKTASLSGMPDLFCRGKNPVLLPFHGLYLAGPLVVQALLPHIMNHTVSYESPAENQSV